MRPLVFVKKSDPSEWSDDDRFSSFRQAASPAVKTAAPPTKKGLARPKARPLVKKKTSTSPGVNVKA
jgi:hypothetical protein